MANDLVYGGGGLQPYHGGGLRPQLAPAPDFGTTDVDLLRDTTYTGSSHQIFGQPLPPGVSLNEAVKAYRQLGDVFQSDFLQLGHDISRSQKAVAWFINALTNPPAQQPKRHSYNLFEHSNDPIFQAFANYASDNKLPAKFVQDACWWVTEAGKRLNSQQFGTQPAQGSAPHSAEAMLNSLSDADYNKVIKINDAAKAKTMQLLAAKYGEYSVQQVVDIGQKYLESLPAHERANFDQFTTGWVHSLNTVEVIEALYNMAIGANSIGSGADLAKEIASFEAMLKIPAERAKYMRDPVLQARLVELYRRRES